MAHHLWQPVRWDIDSLYYQSQVLELRGMDARQARHEVFASPLADYARALHAQQGRILDDRWVEYFAPFYRRRWTLSVLGDPLEPIWGPNSLEIITVLGFVLVGPLIYLLLRRRFTVVAAAVATLGVLGMHPLRTWTSFPMTDSWALALLAAALLLASRVLKSGRHWLIPWMLCVFALGFTRETALVLALAMVLLALVRRTRRTVALAATGILAAAPPLLFFGASSRQFMAAVESNNYVPKDDSWAFIASHYLPNVWDNLGEYVAYIPQDPLTVVAFVLGTILLYKMSPRGDDLFFVLKAMPVGYLIFLAVGFNFSRFRYELVLYPGVAAGLCFGIERCAARFGFDLQTFTRVGSGRGAATADPQPQATTRPLPQTS